MLITSMLRSHALVDFIVLSFVLLCAQGAYVSVLAGGRGGGVVSKLDRLTDQSMINLFNTAEIRWTITSCD